MDSAPVGDDDAVMALTMSVSECVSYHPSACPSLSYSEPERAARNRSHRWSERQDSKPISRPPPLRGPLLDANLMSSNILYLPKTSHLPRPFFRATGENSPQPAVHSGEALRDAEPGLHRDASGERVFDGLLVRGRGGRRPAAIDGLRRSGLARVRRFARVVYPHLVPRVS